MTIPIYVAYSERRNQLTKADAEEVEADELWHEWNDAEE